MLAFSDFFFHQYVKWWKFELDFHCFQITLTEICQPKILKGLAYWCTVVLVPSMSIGQKSHKHNIVLDLMSNK